MHQTGGAEQGTGGYFCIKERAIDIHEVYSLEELADLLASLGPQAIQVIARLLKTKLELEMAVSEPKDTKQIRFY